MADEDEYVRPESHQGLRCLGDMRAIRIKGRAHWLMQQLFEDAQGNRIWKEIPRYEERKPDDKPVEPKRKRFDW